jgi:hypothetical protein
MTSIELLKQDLDAELKLGTKMVVNWDMYIEMHKQEIIDARDNMQKSCIELANKINPHLFEFNKKDGEQYYQETFGSKGSDAEKTNSQRFDEFMGLVTSSQTEISDTEIEFNATNAWVEFNKNNSDDSNSFYNGWGLAIKWYREQLKQRQ